MKTAEFSVGVITPWKPFESLELSSQYELNSL